MGHAVLFFPVIGVFLGLVLWLVFKIMTELQAPLWLSAALVLTTWVLCTGGLHLDGLADTVDAWAGGRGDRERILAIMKDPNCGAMAIIAIFLVLLLKFTALAYLQADNKTLLILTVPTLSRTTLPLLFLTTPYVRTEGLGAAMAAYLPRRQASITIVAICIGIIVLAGLAGLFAIIIGMLVFGVLQRMMLSAIGGATGDTAGALVEIVETVLLVVLVLTNGM